MTTSVSAQTRTIRIASRKSQLALVQTYWVQEELQKRFPDIKFEVHTMSTQGDKILDVALAKIGDKGLFTKELEVGMLNHDTDMAVHSLKDLPTNLLQKGDRLLEFIHNFRIFRGFCVGWFRCVGWFGRINNRSLTAAQLGNIAQ